MRGMGFEPGPDVLARLSLRATGRIQIHPQNRTVRCRSRILMRGMGFEPTNPYGSGS